MSSDTERIIAEHYRAICACEELIAERKRLTTMLTALIEQRHTLYHVASAHIRDMAGLSCRTPHRAPRVAPCGFVSQLLIC